MNILLKIIVLTFGFGATLFLVYWIYKVMWWYIEDFVYYMEHRHD